MNFHKGQPKEDLRVLFGPQCPDITDSITHIRDAISKDPTGLGFLTNILDELPSLWPTIAGAWPALKNVEGENQLLALGRLFEHESEVRVEASNLMMTPITVMRHVVDFWNLQDVATHPAFPSSSLSETEMPRIVDTQGFCVGLLAAIAVACSRNTQEFQYVASNAIRLSLCIGALVDLDEILCGSTTSLAVRWESVEDFNHLEKILNNNTEIPKGYTSCYTDVKSVTITIPNDSAERVKQEIHDHGLRTKQLSLRGRFHHEAHREGIQHIMKLCMNDSRFKLPRSDALLTPLRSSQGGEIFQQEALLHTVALDSILCAKANWYDVVSALINSTEMTVDQSRLLSIGPEEFVPRSARSRSVARRELESYGMQGFANESPQPSTASLSNSVQTFDSRPQAAEASPIAITGMACRYPNADTLAQLWELLELGRCTVKSPPESRFHMSDLQREPKGPFWGHFLERPDVFDHRFFNISAREAESMDPQQRVALQVAYEAMESAGYLGWQPNRLSQDIGCYVGVGSEDYTENVASRNANAFSITGTLQSFIAGRISHHFGWSGPSISLDTACSSAAVAIHLACKALQTNDCKIALAGGVNVLTNPRVYQNLSAASFLSPSGACKPFDASADGYCRGEGAGLFVLRPLQDAIDNGDPILGVIAGSAVNQGSNNSPITVPDAEAQRSLYNKAMSLAGVSPDEVTYVEAHGTGTQVGDPIELDSLRRTFGGPHRRNNLHIGSIKGNIGHTETSSGAAGLLKTILMLQQQRIPRQANFNQLNPKVKSLTPDRLVIASESTEWVSTKRVAMVSNYGASGSNAALIVKEHAPIGSEQNGTAPEYIQNKLAYNLAMKQNRDLPLNLTFSTSSDTTSLGARLEAISTGASADLIQKRPSNEPPVVLCFGGQNGLTATISKEVFDASALLRTHLEDCEEVGRTLGLLSLFPTIFSSAPITNIIHLHFILFSIQYASAKAWLDSGLRVSRIVGHSFGQLTALSVAGSLSVRDGIHLVTERARLIESSWGPESGIMLAVEGTEIEVQQLLDQTVESIEAIENAAARTPSASNLRLTRLQNSHAFHSRLVDSIVPGIMEVAGSLVYQTPIIPIEACSASGDWSTITAAEIVEHSRMPVYFRRAVERVAEKLQAPAVWLEAGSASPIIPMVRRVLESSSVANTYHKIDLGGSSGAQNLANVTSALWAQGVHVQFWPFDRAQHASFKWMNLPPYQFAQNSHWVDFDPAAFSSAGPSSGKQSAGQEAGLLCQLSESPDERLYHVNIQDALYRACTQGHAVLNQTLCPASMYMEMVLRAAASIFPTGNASEPAMSHIEDLTISSPLVLDPQGKVFLRLTRDGAGPTRPWLFSIFSSESNDHTLVHAEGTVCLHQERSRALARFQSMDRLLDSARSKTIEADPASNGLKGSTVYAALESVTNYGDYFRGVKQVFANGREASGLVSMMPSTTETNCNPILLDNFLQVAGIHVNCLSDRQSSEVFVCNAIGETFVINSLLKQENGASPSTWKVYTSYVRPSKTEIACDIYVMDCQTDTLSAAMMGVRFTSVSIRSLTRALAKLNNNVLETAEAQSVVEAAIPAEQSVVTATPSAPAADGHAANDLATVQEMLCELFGVSVAEVSPSVSLVDIGVDSLMSTEVLSEIKKRFQVDMSYTTLVDIPNIQGLVEHIFPGHSHAAPSRPVVEKAPVQSVAPQAVSHVPTPASNGPPLVSVARQCFDTTHAAVSHTSDAHWAGFFHTTYPKQMSLLTAYILEAFRALGSSLEASEPNEVLTPIAVLPRHEQLRKHLYKILDSVGLVRQMSTGELTLRQSGFEWVDWTNNETVESNALRVIVASPTGNSSAATMSPSKPIKMETVVWGERDNLQLRADIYYPETVDTTRKQRPIALMIHGGGHVMLSRKDIRPAQTQTLLDAGFLPVSIDYRLCPEVSLAEGPMADARDALSWVRRVLPNIPLLRADIRPDGNQVVAIGWSTGGHLAMTLPFTAPAAGIPAPDAVLAFYCPTNYEDPFWSNPNFPFGQTVASNEMEYDVWEGLQSMPIAGYNPALKERPLGGWMSTRDPRSRIALHMNWTGQTLPVLLKACTIKGNTEKCSPDDLSRPTEEDIQAVSPNYQIRVGRYNTPTFLIHGTSDDLVPCAQTESTHGALTASGVEAELRVVQEAAHLFDLYPASHAGQEAKAAVAEGYEFLRTHVQL
uniref:Non-reducing polyketide synthase mapC' n=1 Tax=Penicillium brevicompactum TaxID=5074 RepID=MPAC2_PENBR|nr:RecName: Full=Non-reducing polyketide synthase mapC'; AltName: Full=Mycophenolic acid biosynthesis cluster protein C' [Penicillium brevicompactum]AJG44381.1 MpaC' [Penicillium brevicompactum]